ncbi:sigma 54-interacting transcriptional regulator [Sporosarcina ureilytica]|uniref:Transcriptional regulator n=1 Tax=Sporosarcina ureilytica TaxID=298596 RepID=A0A1D8JE75_9BACL|nr:sigma 54-interacting transcriptional regulator [Sporosarcina ureilytica]AOV07015.1 transcriptional regulator [Sporosarcina ureilytica]
MQKNIDFLRPFYTFAVEQAGVGIHAIDKQGRTIIYNKKMKQIEGLALEDIQDRTIVELFNFEHDESTLLKVLQSGKELLNVKQTYWNRNGIQITTINDTYPIFDGDKLIGAVELSRDITALENLLHQPIQQSNDLAVFSLLTAASNSMKTVIATAKKAAKAKLPVLLIGEAGTGKDLLAQSIHSELSLKNDYFYTLHCRNSDSLTINRLNETLTGDESLTLFCERIDLLTMPLQQKLLDILTKKERQNLQFIASIGDDPVDLIASGVLLKDLYYFFASFAIQIPPLRKRKKDIMPFIDAYLTKRSAQYKSSLIGVTPEIEKIFNHYHWPGNMRELEFLLDEITSLATTETMITYEMLPLHFRLKNGDLNDDTIGVEDFIVQRDKDLLPLDQYLKEAEAYYVEKALKLYEGNITKTAHALGMSRQSLQYRLRKIKES